MFQHPTHPATVHFPVTFSVLTGALDLLTFLSRQPATAKYTYQLFSLLALDDLAPQLLPQLSYHTTRALLLVSVPAVITGAIEVMPLIKREGISSKKARTAILHALLNDVTVVGALWNWWTRRDVEGYTPSDTNVFLSGVVALPVTVYAAYLGGHLVYQYGMGVGRGNAPVKPKKNE
ncbi:uncharacterized protein EI97DRAFT_320039 [Westerdykella ornata]|uniref:DUF2231 domain-containing protein n=1 Tax=Westerdykella ornata TaxID=318751 RepID=A0A6A6JKI8_WESOR|nr:uncharacterized protein EI97DRAFT_320039 [Westerdykella ornata]KAF2276745.1 hypothetical protein EI97DRAFT_320039 [Westerdykella ornata]